VVGFIAKGSPEYRDSCQRLIKAKLAAHAVADQIHPQPEPRDRRRRQQRVDWARRQVNPTKDEDAGLVAAAGRIAGRISAELKSAAA
jgi:hypothetical protein